MGCDTPAVDEAYGTSKKYLEVSTHISYYILFSYLFHLLFENVIAHEENMGRSRRYFLAHVIKKRLFKKWRILSRSTNTTETFSWTFYDSRILYKKYGERG